MCNIWILIAILSNFKYNRYEYYIQLGYLKLQVTKHSGIVSPLLLFSYTWMFCICLCKIIYIINYFCCWLVVMISHLRLFKNFLNGLWKKKILLDTTRIKCRENINLRGTARYVSMNTHLGIGMFLLVFIYILYSLLCSCKFIPVFKHTLYRHVVY